MFLQQCDVRVSVLTVDITNIGFKVFRAIDETSQHTKYVLNMSPQLALTLNN